jgi:Asp-tRNA(Asn)/Glu-tRNA(Gln) amidotransferase A subunit family amidase
MRVVLQAMPQHTVANQQIVKSKFNVAGDPTISVCSDCAVIGLPLTFQLVGKPFVEATC